MVGQSPISPPAAAAASSGEDLLTNDEFTESSVEQVPAEAATQIIDDASAAAADAVSAVPDASVWSSLITSTLGVFDSTVKRAVASNPVRRLQECIMGFKGANGVLPGAPIWFLGACYNLSSEDQASSARILEEFMLDFSSRVWITYRRGFEAIGNSKYTSDQGWGCMIRSGQMLCAEALVCHHLGRSWRKGEKPYSREYLEILQSFGDTHTEPFSIHNFITAGSSYGLSAGSWLGPYALCRAVEAVTMAYKGDDSQPKKVTPIAVYVVSGDADGERGGAPVLCKEDVANMCSTSVEWSPVLILVPLVLGLDKVNPRYLPSLRATFSFPQSLGIAGGKPAASTYLVGVQDDQAIYLDPHEVQKVVKISATDANADTSSYHCGVVRRMALDAIDPSLALGFYCRNREEFDDLCARASELASQSNGAPMFTVVEQGVGRRKNDPDIASTAKTTAAAAAAGAEIGAASAESCEDLHPANDATSEEEDWQIL